MGKYPNGYSAYKTKYKYCFNCNCENRLDNVICKKCGKTSFSLRRLM